MDNFRDTYNRLCSDEDYFDSLAAEAVKVPEMIEPAMRSQSERYRFWATCATMASDVASRLDDHRKDVVLSDCMLRAIESLEEAGQKPTEKKIEAVAKRDPAFLQATEAVRDAQAIADKFRKIEQALFQKKEMMQSINSRQCRELSSL